MAEDPRFLLHFATKAKFDEKFNDGTVNASRHICFIKDTKQIWCRGEFYADNSKISDITKYYKDWELVQTDANSVTLTLKGKKWNNTSRNWEDINDTFTLNSATDSIAGLMSGAEHKLLNTDLPKQISDLSDTLSSHIDNKSNPHEVTKTLIGLGNVDNTSDTNKPVSTAQANAIADAKKAGTDAQTNLTTHIGNTSNPHSVTATQVGLGNVTNESKTTMFTSPTFTGTPKAPTAATTTNNTQIATTAFVKNAIAEVVANADSDFDTLKEIADWISGHANDASAMNTAIAANKTAIENEVTNRNSAITSAINNLDANVTSTDGTNVLVKVTETDGKITAVNITTDNTSNKNHTHNYAGSSSAGGSATSAEKLNSNAGSTTQPIYFKDGKPSACTYELNKTVPDNAVFTDTTYSVFTRGTSTGGAGKNGLVPAPIYESATETRYLRADGTWITPPNDNTTYSTVSKTASGLCPKLPNETTTDKYLRLDGSWVIPAKADQLTTTRTLWGLNFNGTANVTGSLSNVGNITPTTNRSYSIGSSEKMFWNSYIYRQNSRHIDGYDNEDYEGNKDLYLQYYNEGNTFINYKGGKVYIGKNADHNSNDYTLQTIINNGLHVDSILTTGEIISNFPNAFRAVWKSSSKDSGRGFIIRNDGDNTYFLISKENDGYGGFNNNDPNDSTKSLRPFTMNNENGFITIGNGASIHTLNTGNITNSGTITSDTIVANYSHLVNSGNKLLSSLTSANNFIISYYKKNGNSFENPVNYMMIESNLNTHFYNNVYAKGSVTPNYASDNLLKENINSIENATEILSKLNPISFNWNDKAKELDSHKDDRINYGLIAQEVEKTLPGLINSIYNDYKSLDYIQLISILIKANQELNEKNKDLENRLSKIEKLLNI